MTLQRLQITVERSPVFLPKDDLVHLRLKAVVNQHIFTSEQIVNQNDFTSFFDVMMKSLVEELKKHILTHEHLNPKL